MSRAGKGGARVAFKTSIPEADYQRLEQLAQLDKETVQDLVRRLIFTHLAKAGQQ